MFGSDLLCVQLTIRHEPRARSGDRDGPGMGHSFPGATIHTEIDPHVTVHLLKGGHDLAVSLRAGGLLQPQSSWCRARSSLHFFFLSPLHQQAERFLKEGWALGFDLFSLNLWLCFCLKYSVIVFIF